jgi:hypothetical protein
VILGNKARFAIEFYIDEAYEQPSLKGLGYFVIHLNGIAYGVCEADATMLACSVDGVVSRLHRRGEHIASFASEAAGRIGFAVRNAIYASESKAENYFGISHTEFSNLLYDKELMWAPDGDAAFDDGSYVLQFDIEQKVRLIAFRFNQGGRGVIDLSDLWLLADEYYSILGDFHKEFMRQWASMPKRAA